MEHWKDVVGYEGYYEVSNTGKLRHAVTKRERYLGFLDKGGYQLTSLSKRGNKKSFLIHRLVAIAFIDNPNNYATVNHINGNKLNNSVANLEWCSLADNVKHAWRTGLTPSSINAGENNGNAKLTKEQVLSIRSSYVLRSKTNGAKALSEKYGVTYKTVLRIISRELWKNI